MAPGTFAQSGPANAEWPHHGRDHAFTRYSPLDQIDAANFEQLEVAWRWKSADHDLREEPGTFRGSALMIDGRVYMATSLWQIVALDAATGEELWLYDPKSYEFPQAYGATPRGLEYWTDGEAERIIFITSGKQLISLDLATGRPDPAFGEDGMVDLSDDRLGREEVFQRDISAGSPGIVIRDTFVVGSRIADAPATKQGLPPGHVRAYDVRTGEPKWRFHTIPREGEEFTETWHNDSWKWVGGANVWGAMAGDEELGYVYIPTTTPTGNLWGGHRPGANVYAESLLCLDAETGERVWHFQAVHHGIWDWDIASAPVLADVVIDGRLRKIVAQVSKTAFTYVFDRVTGEPIWPIEERPVPQTTVPGEWTAPTQPFPTRPAAFDLQGVTIDDLIDFTPELRAEALEIADEFLLGPMFTPPIVAGEGGKTATLAVPGMAGGANHPGASLDPLTGVLYVQSRTQPTGVAVAPPDPARSEWRWVSRGGRVGSPQGLPLLKPPYQRITAIDLNTGEHAWMAPFGEGPTDHPAISHLDLGPLGSRPSSGNREGGLLITRTLLITYVPNWPSWDARAARGSYLQAYDKATGKLLAEVETEATLHGVPMTYLHQGRQYIVVPAGGKVVSRTARSGPETAELVAFALPATPEPPPSRPNVVLMMSDDQGWGAVEYSQQLAPGHVHPGHPEIRTPNLRAMAEAGLQFHRMYSGGSVCSPTRSSFVTGRAPRHDRHRRPRRRRRHGSVADPHQVRAAARRVRRMKGGRSMIVKRRTARRSCRRTSWFATAVVSVAACAVAAAAPAAESEIPRMPGGEPDLSGTYTVNTLTPFERHPRYGDDPYMTAEEARRIEQSMAARVAQQGVPGDPDRSPPPDGGYAGGRVTGANALSLLDMGTIVFTVDGRHRNSVLTDPPNGRMPPVTEAGGKRRPAFTIVDRMGPPNPDGAWWLRADEVAGIRGRAIPTTNGEHRIFDDPELIGLWERCIYSDRATIPTLRRGYGAYYGITQTTTHVVILAELMHEARIVRFGSEHPPKEVLSYAGESIGRWEGDTLVVDTTNFRRRGVARDANERRKNARSPSGVPHEGLHIVERFTPQEGGSLFYEFSVDDPDYEATWGGSFPWLHTNERIYEYACHEGNYSMGMTMRGARQLEKEWAERR